MTEDLLHSPFTLADLEMLSTRGIELEELNRQFALLREGISPQVIVDTATLEQGIVRVEASDMPYYLMLWHDYLQQPSADVIKFVPASGAASRMFQDLYNLGKNDQIEYAALSRPQQIFIDHIEQFAFYEALSEACLRNSWRTINKLIESKQFGLLIHNLLDSQGLNYGSVPKGMILFHQYEDGRTRTAIDEHLVEGALYCQNISGRVQMHFTISPEHLESFRSLVDRHIPLYEEQFGCHYEISYSVQHKNTDTIALDMETGQPFRHADGSLLLRPGGHGTLISNLNDLNGDIVFIKNIDNVTLDHLKCNTVLYKKLLGGILLAVRDKIYGYLHLLQRTKVSRVQIEEVVDFMSKVLFIQIPNSDVLSEEELVPLLVRKLNRPIRICGMVPNEGAPGGGPYLVREEDGSTSLQILEAMQLNQSSTEEKELLSRSTHFNPVDLCCCLKDYKGESFDLRQYVNPDTAFLSDKSIEGRAIKALEHPGLWNGAMHDWNTVFVEVPKDTFTPVKSVLDLLNQEHQKFH